MFSKYKVGIFKPVECNVIMYFIIIVLITNLHYYIKVSLNAKLRFTITLFSTQIFTKSFIISKYKIHYTKFPTHIYNDMDVAQN